MLVTFLKQPLKYNTTEMRAVFLKSDSREFHLRENQERVERTYLEVAIFSAPLK